MMKGFSLFELYSVHVASNFMKVLNMITNNISGEKAIYLNSFDFWSVEEYSLANRESQENVQDIWETKMGQWNMEIGGQCMYWTL